ncbi:hypothetical protein B9Z50_16485 [Limnohabitans sp. Bal53]|nr:hypothetical protein B9Z50_16485 [Limnohabitans sp. Bal53]
MVAFTVQVYEALLVRPETVIGLLEDVPVTAVAEPVTQEAVYAVMFAPPLEDGSENAMLAWLLPAVAAPIVGAPGTDAAASGVTMTDPEADPVPTLLVAVTVQV